MQRAGAVGAILAHHHADRDHRPVARLDFDAFCGVGFRIVAARDFLLLEQFQLAAFDVIVEHRIRRDHALVGQAQLVLVVFGIVGQPGGETCFRKSNRFHQIGLGVGSQLDLVEALHAPLGDEEIAEQFEPVEIEFVRPFDQRFPCVGHVERRGGEAEVDVVVIGVDPQRAVPNVDIVFDALHARFDDNRLGGRIVCRHQPHFAGFVVAGRYDQPVFLSAEARTDAEALVQRFAIEFDILRERRAQHVQRGIVHAPVLVGEAIDQRRVAHRPDEAR